ncbi:MAG: efflux RND transporter periplasmic adaptor subunit [Proteobacteria bacterium]|nr:efflux RND transporter periplasmic adaptor subunit [Pseudomonadota bacterium]
MQNKKKVAWIVGIAILLIGAVVLIWVLESGKKSDLHFETAAVDRGPIIAKVTASGTLSALVDVLVGSQVSGRIKEILVDFNSPVKKGELIARIDPQLFQAALDQTKANFMAAQGDLTSSKVKALDAGRQLKRAQDLAEKKLIAQADLDTAQANSDMARAQVEAAKGRVEQARASLHQAEVNLAYTDIYSPISGVVISRSVDVGQTVAASLQAPTLFEIAEDLRKMQVDTSVGEADIGRLQPGMKATFSVDAYPAVKFSGTIRQIRNAPQTLQNVVTYDTVIDVENPDLKLKPGMTANVTFIVAEKENVLRVPSAALRFHPPSELIANGKAGNGDKSQPGPGLNKNGKNPTGAEPRDRRTVWVDNGGTPRPVPIKTGITDGSLTEIVEGELKEGDKLITDATSSTTTKSGGAPNPFRMH